jgi:phosphomannomutase / phosphoglucomutase
MTGESRVNSVIFRSLDIRGKVGSEITENTAGILGQALGTYALENGCNKIFVGRDNRPSSPVLAESFMYGLCSTGCDVLDLGIVPTPVVYFASDRKTGTMGAMVTASHLPATSNGFKFCKGKHSLHTEINGRIKQLALSNKFAAGQGHRIDTHNVLDEYAENMSHIKLGFHDLKVILDCQNGAASLIAPHVMKNLEINFESIFSDINAQYPYERPDPQITSNLTGLIDRVKSTGADLGIAFDGDADRLGVVDDHGKHVAVDLLLALFAAQVLKDHPGGTVVYDALCSQVFVDEITRNGGHAVASRSGHAYVKELLSNEKGVLGGELSGHIFFADRYPGFDDGIYASLRLIELLSASSRSLSDMLDDLPKLHSSPEQRPFCPDEYKSIIISEMENLLRSEGFLVETADGVRIKFPGGWGILRPSGTEPVLSLRFEAETTALLESYQNMIWTKLNIIGKINGLTFVRG